MNEKTVILGLRQEDIIKYKLETDRKELPTDVVERLINEAVANTAKQVADLQVPQDKQEIINDFMYAHKQCKAWRTLSIVELICLMLLAFSDLWR